MVENEGMYVFVYARSSRKVREREREREIETETQSILRRGMRRRGRELGLSLGN